MATSLQREDLESISGTVHSMDDMPCSVMVVSHISLSVVAVRQVLVEVLEELLYLSTELLALIAVWIVVYY